MRKLNDSDSENVIALKLIEDTCNVTVKGDPNVLVNMLVGAMENNQLLANIIIASISTLHQNRQDDLLKYCPN